MLSSKELSDILTRYQYKPGWSLTVFENWHGPTLRLVTTVPNSYNPNDDISLGINSPIPPMETKEQFLTWVQWRLIQVEEHESREWFRDLEGNPVFDPHGKEG